jgi:hypothetical protein
MANPYGRPPHHDFTKPKTLEKVRDLASRGMAEKNIARCLGYNETYFIELKKKHPELAEALKEGHALGEEIATEALMSEVRGRNMTALIFYLKSKHKWRENDIPTLDDGTDGDSATVSRRVLERLRRNRGSGGGSGSAAATD